MKDTKQVIVIRTHYPNGEGGLKKISKGKAIAQASHASMSFLTRPLSENIESVRYSANLAHPKPEKVLDCVSFAVKLSQAERNWLEFSFAKVTLQVKTEEELIDIYNKAAETKITCYMVTDEGRTEFNGVPTKTCLALGPDYCEEIDKITKDLSLYT